MGHKFQRVIPAIVVMACGAILPLSLANGQAVSLQEQLAAQYKLVKMGSDTSGYSVVEEGTLLAVQKGGLLGVPYSDKAALTNKYEGGTVHGPSGLMVSGKRRCSDIFLRPSRRDRRRNCSPRVTRYIRPRLKSSAEKDTVTMGIVSCDTCNKTDPPTYNKAAVVFVFPKGSLAKASAGDVEDTIGQLLAISEDSQQQDQAGGDQNQQGQGGQDQQGGQPQQAQQAPAAEPQTIEKGQTPDQVQGSLGKPDKIVNLGSKQIWVYKDLKVTFVNGKVSDVQ